MPIKKKKAVGNSVTFTAVIDRFEQDFAILVCDTDYREVLIPRLHLPAAFNEGAVVSVTLKKEPKEEKKRLAMAKNLISAIARNKQKTTI